MTNEIKEILDYFRKYMSIKDCIKLCNVEDYITNLQEELEKTKLENKVLKEQMVAMVQPNYVYGIELKGEDK